MLSSCLILRYSDDMPTISRLQDTAKGIIRPFCEANKFLFEGRIKSRESVSEKLETGMYSKWEDINDLYACTIVVNLPSDEASVLKFISESFVLDEDKTRYKGKQNKPADVFRYDSTRTYCKLRKPAHIESSQGACHLCRLF